VSLDDVQRAAVQLHRARARGTQRDNGRREFEQGTSNDRHGGAQLIPFCAGLMKSARSSAPAKRSRLGPFTEKIRDSQESMARLRSASWSLQTSSPFRVGLPSR